MLAKRFATLALLRFSALVDEIAQCLAALWRWSGNVLLLDVPWRGEIGDALRARGCAALDHFFKRFTVILKANLHDSRANIGLDRGLPQLWVHFTPLSPGNEAVQ